MAYDLSALKVLVVDDNVHMHQIMRSILGAMRIREVLCVVDTGQAFQELARWHPDLLITDVMIGEEDGIGFVDRVRQGEKAANPYLPVIVLTGHTERQLITRARDVGVHEVLAKPVSIENLYRRIVGLVTNPRPFVKTSFYFGPCRRRQEKPFRGPERRGDEPEGEASVEIPEEGQVAAAQARGPASPSAGPRGSGPQGEAA